MATIATGIALSGFFKPFIGTFLTFSDYMKNGIRLAALMNVPVIYQFTHDSILLGEDGPTHQPVEHLASLRSIPGLTVIRPADSTEVKGAWRIALTSKTPTAFILFSTGVKRPRKLNQTQVEKGAYIIKQAVTPTSIDYSILATGAEVNLALDVAKILEDNNKSVQVVSFPSWELFEEQDTNYKNSILNTAEQTIVIEAQSSFGWHKYAGRDGLLFTVDTYGLSAKASDVAHHFGFEAEKIAHSIVNTKKQLSSFTTTS